MEGILWSDPQSQAGSQPSNRGAGILFGKDITHAFLKKNKLDLLVRSHEVN